MERKETILAFSRSFVPGDVSEEDIIYFSTNLTDDEVGKVAYRFGPDPQGILIGMCVYILIGVFPVCETRYHAMLYRSWR